MKKVKKKKLTKAEKITKKINDYIQEHFSYEVVKGDVGDTVINVLNKVRLQNNIWTTAKGKRLAIDELSDDHLDNILKHLEERAKIQAVKESVEDELEEIMYQWRKNLPIIYNLLREERDKRLKNLKKMKEYTCEGTFTITLDAKNYVNDFTEFIRRIKEDD